MFKKLLNKKLLKNQKGLTLIELLAVIVILAIVAAIAVPAIGNVIQNSKYNAIKADAINVLNAANIYYTDNPDANDGVTVEELINENYLDSAGKLPLKDTEVSKDVPRKINVTVEKVLKHSIEFKDATIDKINGDNKKGSKIEGKYTVGSNK
ncbi:type II secretion system protein [Lysinibacillus pakistanensis]|uniref:Prepilin-type N-terminal cleavage/methylation domain-containing protein n=1 Tax=Lysinibacillus pakistanensis TaxID=759811 RepID=A0ABX6DA88_9BACI|nr:prepilin-type N-terminal cleavage/methylation domain-containing protein [Lysinibacillus pakistanensis]